MRRRLTTVFTYAVGTVAIVFACTLAGLFLFDRWVDAPRQSTLRVSVEQSQRNGANLCNFAAATASALDAISQSSDLSPRQREAVDEMVRVANDCKASSEDPTDP